jgi:serine/threonine protein phosphatase 1
MNGRLIAIGDIHGCHAEFAELLERVEPTADDQLVLLGDLVNRGPDSLKVIDLAKQHRAISLLGNHELRLLNYRKTKDASYLKETDEDTYERLRPDDWTYLEAMPLPMRPPICRPCSSMGDFYRMNPGANNRPRW